MWTSFGDEVNDKCKLFDGSSFIHNSKTSHQSKKVSIKINICGFVQCAFGEQNLSIVLLVKIRLIFISHKFR
jgi:hypothetical protein